jgi:endoglucanase
MNRRQFISTSAGIAAPLVLGLDAQAELRNKLPRWRGFNLLAKFNANRPEAFLERDFAWIKEWGFDFVRLPMSYHCWAKPDIYEWTNLDETQLQSIDQAVEWGKAYRIHVNLNMHRIPGYCVNPPEEPLNLWKNETALNAAITHWQHFARRYKTIPNKWLSFDLINEPPDIPAEDYDRVIRVLVKAIREVDKDRLIVADGLRWGTTPVPSLADLGIGQSTRGYNPMQVSHYKAGWVKGSDAYAEPSWPLQLGSTTWNKDLLRERYIKPWQALQAKGVGIHVGEWGAFQHTPHEAALRWMEDNLQLWKEAGWGWSLWNFSGSFGILNSGRKDVKYETFRGEQLDRKMLEMLRQY